MISWFLTSIVILAGSGIASWTVGRTRLSTILGASGAVLACTIGAASSLHVLLSGAPETLRLPWHLPLASFSIEVDPLSAFFLLPTFVISALAAVYGAGYLRAAPAHPEAPGGAHWLWFNLLLASMATVIMARNGLLFLVAWELMTIASYALVTTHHERSEVRRAGRIYLVAAHIGTAFLLVMFLLLGDRGSLDFDTFGAAGSRAASASSAIFLLAVLGFGVKAGFVPLHVWLPEAHPAAPSHVSAVMSGIMIKLGIYGLLRVLPFLGDPPLWWGWLLVLVGLVSAILGVLYALAQHELKRLLAYHSVENIGIITMGMGLGLIGVTRGSGLLAAFGFGAALFHVLNHAIFKALLFLAAGAVIREAGSGEIERLGGLIKRMPWTAGAFLIGSVAISGLPPLNGFVSEFLLFLGAIHAVVAPKLPVAIAGVTLLGGLALVGGLAAACFAKAFGIVFLGEPRTDEVVREAGVLMRAPMLILALACAAVGIASPWILPLVARVLPAITGVPIAMEPEVALAGHSLMGVTVIATVFLAWIAAFAILRKLLLRGRDRQVTVTWDCGYARPTPRMRYTASSFAQPILDLFAPLLGTRVAFLKPRGLFPPRSSLETATPDTFRERVFRPLFGEVDRFLARFRRIQEGRVQIYVLYIAVTLLLLLAYQFVRNP